jgi:hypothetical protein
MQEKHANYEGIINWGVWGKIPVSKYYAFYILNIKIC